MRKITSLILILSATISLKGQSVEQDKSSIKAMCGCYEVSFKYAETFAEDTDYERHEDYSARGLEWIFVEEESPEMVMLQHLLIVRDSMIIKHWRQDWLYENAELLTYQKNLEWRKEMKSAEEVSGTWTQKVYEVDESPRYQGYATWVRVDGKDYWESQVAAPLPRREYTKRSDYNLMLRNNKLRITTEGHVHELDNAKVIRTQRGDSTLVWEKGLNSYQRVADSRCELARQWWQQHRLFWSDVREVWSDLIEEDYVNLKWEVEGDRLWQRIFALQNKLHAQGGYKAGSAKEDIRKLISQYLSDEPSPWVSSTMYKERSY